MNFWLEQFSSTCNLTIIRYAESRVNWIRNHVQVKIIYDLLRLGVSSFYA